MKRTKQFPGFSLVELVIVIVIIGIIAAIAVPRVSQAGKGAADSAVRGNLATLRGAIDVFQAEHGGILPGADNSATTFVDQLTKKTDAAGVVGTSTTHIYGPYLRNGLPPLPVGPNKGAKAVKIADTGPAVAESEATVGWVYNSKTGDIIANTDDTDSSQVAYNTY